MNYRQQSGKSIQEAFVEFHEANPEVYNYFKKYFFHLHDRKGWEQVSAKLIVEHIRWEALMMTKSPDFKIDNNFTAHYVRLFLSDYPEYDYCFKLRSIKPDMINNCTAQMRPSISDILTQICDVHKVPMIYIKSGKRKKEYVRVRQQYCLIASLFKYGLETIGAEINRDHSTAIHNRNNALKFCNSEADYLYEVKIIINDFPKYKSILLERLSGYYKSDV